MSPELDAFVRPQQSVTPPVDASSVSCRKLRRGTGGPGHRVIIWERSISGAHLRFLDDLSSWQKQQVFGQYVLYGTRMVGNGELMPTGQCRLQGRADDARGLQCLRWLRRCARMRRPEFFVLMMTDDLHAICCWRSRAHDYLLVPAMHTSNLHSGLSMALFRYHLNSKFLHSLYHIESLDTYIEH
jgi:hypothetical protein